MNEHMAKGRAARDMAAAALKVGPTSGAISIWHQTMTTERRAAAQRERDKWERKFTHPKLLRSFPPNC